MTSSIVNSGDLMASNRRLATRASVGARVAASVAYLSLVFTIGWALADPVGHIVREPRRGIFLVAAKSLVDPNFSRTVVLLTDHGIAGSIGLIINKISDVAVVSSLPQLAGLEKSGARMRFGGPLEINSVRLLVENAGAIPSAKRLIDGVFFVGSTAVLQSLLTNQGSRTPPTINYYAGYAAWSPGQLAQEIARGDWHLIAAETTTIFDADPDNIWSELIEQLDGMWVQMDKAVAFGYP